MSADRVEALLALVRQGCLDDLKSALRDDDDLNKRSSRGWTLLIAAVHGGHLSIADYLLDIGADPNTPNPKGTTPLMYAKTHAFASGDTSIMTLLIARGADPSLCDAKGLTAADYTQQRAKLILSILRCP